MKICCAFAPVMDTPDHIVLAEELGYRRARAFDTPAVQLDAYATLAVAAVKTSRIELGPGVIIPSLRHVMATASAIATLVGLAPGRINIALGTGFSGRLAMGQKPNKWDDVATYAQQLQGLLAGEIVEVEGAMTKMMHGPGQAPPRPIKLPMLFGTAGPKGEALAHKHADGIFTVIPVNAGFKRQSILVQGTVLNPGESFDSPRVVEAAGGGASVVFHRAYDRPAPGRPRMEELKGGKEWVERIEAFDPAVRHLHTHEGHLAFVNDIDRDIITGDLIEKYTFSGEADALRAKIKELEGIGVTEIAFQPAGPDIPRELRAFAEMAGIGN